MLLHIPEVLSGESLQQVQQLLEQAEWVDGKVTAGTQSAQVKNNMQLPEDSPAAQAAGHIILTALGHHPIFMSAALPKRVFPPLFNCYQGGMAFGNHVDNSVRTIARTGEHIRTDVSCTLFLAEPDSYDGGELIVEDTYGVHSVKLPAGHAVIYPSTSLHRVEPVTQGARVASFFWLQSMIRDDSKRALLFDMDMNIMRLRCKTRPRHQRCQKHSRGGTSPSGCRNPRSLGRGGSQCELDTLAMVMVLEAFEAELK